MISLVLQSSLQKLDILSVHRLYPTVNTAFNHGYIENVMNAKQCDNRGYACVSDASPLSRCY